MIKFHQKLTTISSSDERIRFLLETIQQQLGAEHAMVNQFFDCNNSAKTLCYLREGEVADNFSYEMEGTPCARAILRSDVCIFNEDIVAMFPNNQAFKDWGILSYVGNGLLTPSGEPQGIVICLFKRKVHFSDAELDWLRAISYTLGYELNHRKELEVRHLDDYVFQQTSEAIMVTDHQNNIINVNPALEQITGYCKHELLGKNPAIFSSGRHTPAFYSRMWRQIKATGAWRGEVVNKRKNGQLFPEELAINVVKDKDGSPRYYVAIFRDVGEWKKAQHKLEFFARKESLTGLENRQSFVEQLETHMQLSEFGKRQVCLLFVDIDRFKDINNLYGHEVGDLLLQAVAKRICSIVGDDGVVCRYGADEFTLSLTACSAPQAVTLATDLLTSLQRPFSLNDIVIDISISIGIAEAPVTGMPAGDLLKNANYAVLAAKRDGGARVCVYSDEMQAEYLSKLALRDKLKQALSADQLAVYYQPIVDIADQTVVKFEALVRWCDQDGNFISPAVFIPIAEEFGMIKQLGQFVLDRACHDLRYVRSMGYQDIVFSINRSIHEFAADCNVSQVIMAHGLPFNAIVIEVTESVAMDANPLVEQSLQKMKQSGIRIALDDFCTGYSSLSNLLEYGADYLKIDRSFTSMLGRQGKHQMMVKTLTTLASELNMKVIVEGVEDTTQLNLIKQMGCHYAQGYYFSPAVPLQACVQLLAQGNFDAPHLICDVPEPAKVAVSTGG